MSRIFKICTTLVLSLVLTGCFHFSEDIWIESDASGRIKFDLAISEKLVGSLESMSQYAKDNAENKATELKSPINLETVKQQLETNSYIRKVKAQEYSDAGFRHYLVDVRVKDFHELPKIEEIVTSSFDGNNSKVDDKKPLATFSFTGTNPKNITFEQNLRINDVADKTKTEPSNKATDAVMGVFFNMLFAEEYNYITLHAAHIDDANGLINDEETIVKWSIPFNKLFSPNVLKAEFSYR
ncbi:MAG: hypothetical protein N5P05_004114 (plasmid) [Chroococcopsis gigantea SAG 12.99]|jgi:hypothetical protein|nr:hypothetical protein [Chroococcopsis gigantea SAG 12.99]